MTDHKTRGACTGGSTARPRHAMKNRVATNLRLTRDQWRRVHELALDEEATVQELAIRGLSRLFEERGLPRLNTAKRYTLLTYTLKTYKMRLGR